MTSDIVTRRDAFLALVRREVSLMGILNVTPDSFSDGGQYISTDLALAKAEAMVSDGCDIIDVGGESTRPGATPVDEADELRRVIPVVSILRERLDTPISIDTYKASVARQAVSCGAVVVNDVWGLQRDPAMAETAAELGCAVVAMHNREQVDESIDIIADVNAFFERTLMIAERAGLAARHIILDPGIGFGKSFSQNLTCIAKLDQLKRFGLPILLGVSRKSFIGHVLGSPLDQRLTGTLVSNMVGILRGIDVLRVHDVKEHRQMLSMLKSLEIRC